MIMVTVIQDNHIENYANITKLLTIIGTMMLIEVLIILKKILHEYYNYSYSH